MEYYWERETRSIHAGRGALLLPQLLLSPVAALLLLSPLYNGYGILLGERTASLHFHFAGAAEFVFYAFPKPPKDFDTTLYISFFQKGGLPLLKK
jgi:hypothetical protein